MTHAVTIRPSPLIFILNFTDCYIFACIVCCDLSTIRFLSNLSHFLLKAFILSNFLFGSLIPWPMTVRINTRKRVISQISVEIERLRIV